MTQRKESRKKSTTSLVMIVKKTRLHFCLNVTKYVPSRSYVYFLRRREDSLPNMETTEEVFKHMPHYFEIGYLSQHPLICIDKILSCLYMPMFSAENLKAHVPSKSYEVDDNQISSLFSEFLKDMEDFRDSTKQIISQIEKPFMFSLPEISEDSNPEHLAQETVFTTEAEYLVKDWNAVILDLIEDISQKKPEEEDLLKEVEFWKNQKLKIAVCRDQLSHAAIQKTLLVLKLAKCDIEEFEKNMTRIEEELTRVTDIVNYLLLLELNAKNILSQTSLVESKKCLDELFVTLKIMWVQSDYYNGLENMNRILIGIAILLKKKVKQEARIDLLFKKPLEKAKQTVVDSADILKYWRELYLEECENVKKYGTNYWWTYDVRALFDETDYMITICTDLENVTTKLQELNNIFKTNLRFFVEDMKELNVLKNRIFGMTVIIQYAQFDIFEADCKAEWNKVMDGFFKDVKSFESEVKRYMRTMFQNSLSWENAYILTKSFDKVSVSSLIKEFIAESRTDMLKQFVREIAETENRFLARERDPPLLGEIPETASAILWILDLLSKISIPMNKICDKSDLSEKEIEVYERFKKTEQLLKAYQRGKYESWKVTASDKLNEFLHAKVLRKFQIQTMKILDKTNFEETLPYQVNFLIHLENVSVEAKLLEYLGYDIPSFIKNIILQERMFYGFRNKMKIILEDLRHSMMELKREELSIMVIPLAELSAVLDRGINYIQWESTEILDFLKNIEQAVDVFRGLVTQVKNVVLEIENRIKMLSTCDMFQFNDVPATIPTCESYFGDAQKETDNKIERMVLIYSSLEPLLKKLEMIACKTATGKSKNLKEYYYACEEKIFTALLKVMLDNLEYFEEEILQHYIFPYVSAAFKSKNELIQSSFLRIKLVFVIFLQNAVESTRKVIRWLDGSCIQSSSFYLPQLKKRMEFSYYLDLSLHPSIKKIVLRIIKKFFSCVDNISNENASK